MDKGTRNRPHSNKTNKSRNHRRKRRTLLKRREQIRIEVRTLKREKYKSVTDKNLSAIMKDQFQEPNSLAASAFWENYSAGCDWQRRHNIAWWKTRCMALERENEILRNAVRNLSKSESKLSHVSKSVQQNTTNEEKVETHAEESELEFHMNQEMMDFLEQSIRHKIELKKIKDKEDKFMELKEEGNEHETKFDGGLVWVKEREKGAKILYGKADNKILGLETTLQAIIDKHKDSARPQFWPNIPLRL